MKFGMETKRQMAKQLVPLIKKRYPDLAFVIRERRIKGNPAVILYAVVPGKEIVARINMEEMPRGTTLLGKLNTADSIIKKSLSGGGDENGEDGMAKYLTYLEKVEGLGKGYNDCSREYILRHVLMEPVSRTKNAALLKLKGYAYVKMLDFAVLFVLPVREKGKLTDVVPLTLEQIKSWGFTLEELALASRRNMTRDYPMRVCPMEQVRRVVKEHGAWRGKDLRHVKITGDGWFAIGSHAKILASGYLMVPDVLMALGEIMECGFYIAMLNVHEVIICREGKDREKLRYFVDWLRETQKDSPWQIPDHLYFYERTMGLRPIKHV